MVMGAKWSIPPALLALGLFIKTDKITVGPHGMQTHFSIPISVTQVDFSQYAEETTTQSRSDMVKGMVGEWGNRGNTHHVIGIAGGVDNSPTLEAFLQTGEPNAKFPSGGEWLHYTRNQSERDALNKLDDERKELGYRLIKVCQYGHVDNTDGIEVLALIYALRYAERLSQETYDQILGAHHYAHKRDYWWRNL